MFVCFVFFLEGIESIHREKLQQNEDIWNANASNDHIAFKRLKVITLSQRQINKLYTYNNDYTT